MTVTEIETHTARKKHRCDWCWQFINSGDTYNRYRYYDGGDFGTVKMHPECYTTMQSESKAEGGWITWTPGQERPTPTPASTSIQA